MENTNLSVTKKTRLAKTEDKSSSCSITPTTDNLVKEKMNFDQMYENAIVFSHLPEEIWLLITDKYLDSENLTNLTLASPVFRNLLLPRRVEFLFPQVWKVLGMKFEKQEEEVYSYNEDEMFRERQLPRFANGKTPWVSKILTLRLVCKPWCEGVDKFYENLTRDEKYKMWDDKYERDFTATAMTHWTHTARNSYFVHPTLEDFNNHFDSTHFDDGKKRNPIIARFVSIQDIVARHSGTFSWLQKYGHHFWFCDMELVIGWEAGVDIVACYTHLKEIMQLLPNLKSLRLQYKCATKNDVLEQEVALHPLPKLHRLELLSVLRVPPCIFKALVSGNNHISMLEVKSLGDDRFFDIYSFPMPNLKKLSIQYLSQTDFENLFNQETHWPLEIFYMRFYGNVPVRRSQIFSLLENKWATTLTNVAVILPPTYTQDCLDAEAMSDDLSLRLNLPKVKRLRVESERIFSLDFILPMQSLEFLEVALLKIQLSKTIEKRLRLLEKHQVVQFVGFFRRWNCTLLDGCTRESFVRKEELGAADGPATHSGKDNLWFS